MISLGWRPPSIFQRRGGQPLERWFAEITRKQIRRGTFLSVRKLIKAIMRYLHEYNRNPEPFVWTASAATILRKVRRCKEALDAGH